jgi:hypothetical protein
VILFSPAHDFVIDIVGTGIWFRFITHKLVCGHELNSGLFKIRLYKAMRQKVKIQVAIKNPIFFSQKKREESAGDSHHIIAFLLQCTYLFEGFFLTWRLQRL